MTLTAIYFKEACFKSGLFFRQAIAAETARKGHASYYSETAEGMLETCSCAVFIRAAAAPMLGTDVKSPPINSSHEKICIQKDLHFLPVMTDWASDLPACFRKERRNNEVCKGSKK